MTKKKYKIKNLGNGGNFQITKLQFIGSTSEGTDSSSESGQM
jgi:hypothetical protein